MKKFPCQSDFPLPEDVENSVESLKRNKQARDKAEIDRIESEKMFGMSNEYYNCEAMKWENSKLNAADRAQARLDKSFGY